jgi:hypothetical protein
LACGYERANIVWIARRRGPKGAAGTTAGNSARVVVPQQEQVRRWRRFCPEGGGGGRRMSFTVGGSDEGGFEELVEFRLNLCSSSAIRFSNEATAARMAAWAPGGTAFQSESGIAG